MPLCMVLQPHRSTIALRTFAAGCIVLIAPTVPAQQPVTKPLTFDVVVIRPHNPGVCPPQCGGWNLQPTPDGYDGKNITLYKLVQDAYGISDTKLLTGGPPWINTDKFDLEAKFDPADIPNVKDLTYRQGADMLRPVLADRFHLIVHFETKGFPVYHLVVAEGGPKLIETKPEDIRKNASGTPVCISGLNPKNMIHTGVGCRAEDLEALLRSATGRTVID